jgi:myo-inositol-1(or 4)-monophosphatase
MTTRKKVMKEYTTVAIEAAREAGKYLLTQRGKLSPEQIDLKALNDFVTYVDHHSEKMIVEKIVNHFPSHQILAEEGTRHTGKSEYQWIIDPLDGTKNFIQDVPIFSISIALEKKGEIVIGVVYDPVHDELFMAEKGQGAYCNQRPIGVNSRKISESIIATGFPFKVKNHLPAYLICFEEIFLECSGMRRCGSAAIDLSYTAMGRYDGFWELGLSRWDMAAGSLIIKEANGTVTDFWGGDQYLRSGFIIAGNQQVHAELLKIVQNHFPNKKG